MRELTGTYVLGPESAQLTVLTGTSGPAARVGHNLEITVGEWSATLDLAASKLALKADGASLRVTGSRGSLQQATQSDIKTIQKSIDDKILKRSTVRFNSTSVSAQDGQLIQVSGMLTLLGTARPLEFEVAIDADGNVSGQVEFKQTDWDIKPFAVMGGALKVADKVTVTVAGRLPEAQ
jgi:polyisoprenoid-binding protein YceI